MREQLRLIAQNAFPEIPLPDKEEFIRQTESLIMRYGILRVASIGELASQLIRYRIGDSGPEEET